MTIITEKCINFVPPPVLFLAGTVFPTDALLPLLAGGAVVFFEVEVVVFVAEFLDRFFERRWTGFLLFGDNRIF